MVFSLLPLLVLVCIGVGLYLLVRGLRGSPQLSDPHCVKCGYDLRAHLVQQHEARVCPECGADLNRRGAIALARFERRPRYIAGGAAMLFLFMLLLLAALIPGTRGMVAPIGPNGVSSKSNATLIKELPKYADTPWHWRELESRLGTGKLSNEEASQAMDQLIAFVDATRKTRGSTPLHWAEPFISAVDRAGAITPQQHLKLCHAFYGPQPTIVASLRVRSGGNLAFHIEWGGSWNLSGLRFVKALREVKLSDGTKLTPHDTTYPKAIDPDFFSREGVWPIDGQIPIDLKPGQYEIQFMVDGGVIPEQSPLVGPSRRPGQKSRWVNPSETWSATVPVTLNVLDKDATIIQLITDPALDPMKNSGLARPQVLVRKEAQDLSIEISWSSGSTPAVAVIGDVLLRIDGKERVVLSGYRSGPGSWSSTTSIPASALPPQITKVDVIIRPDVRDAESDPKVTQIWGSDIVFEGVPLKRYDLPAATQ